MSKNEERLFSGWTAIEVIAFVNKTEGLEAVKSLLRLAKPSREILIQAAAIYKKLGLNDLASTLRARARRMKPRIADLPWRERQQLRMRARLQAVRS